MIARDNAEIIEESLASIRPWTDELIVIDTGSSDQTPQLASKMGARVGSFPWIDDFAAARNASLALASGKWVFWMDTDDVIDPINGQKLRLLADADHPLSTLGFVMQVHCPGVAGPASGDITVVDHIKMFRNQSELRFEGRIHEQVLPSIRRCNGEVVWTDIFVTHKHGAVLPRQRAHKHARDLRILHLDLSERDEHPFVLFNLGMTYADMGQHFDAVQYLERSIAASDLSESHVAKAYALLAAAYLQLNDFANADRVCRRALELFPSDAELLFRAAIVAHQLGDSVRAISIYQTILRPKAGSSSARRFSSRDIGIEGHKARHNLAIVLMEQGEMRLAEVEWRRALDEAPEFGAALTGLGQLLVRQGKLVTAAALATQWLQATSTWQSGMLLHAAIAEKRNRPDEAIALLQDARQQCPGSDGVLDELGRLLFLHNRLPEASDVLTELAALRPQDAAVAHNLGSALLSLGVVDEAEKWLQRSLELRPDSDLTRQLWSSCLSHLKSNSNHAGLK